MKFSEISIDQPGRFHFRARPLHALNEIQRTALEAVGNKIQTGQYDFEACACFCGASQDTLLGRYDRYGLPHFSVLCAHCGLIRTSPRLTEESYHDFYEKHFVQLHYGIQAADASFAGSRVRITNHPASGTELLRLLRTQVDLRKTTSVLEIGCGAGWTLVPFKDLGLSVTGCDYDPNQIELGKALFGLDLVCGGVEQVRARGQTFDLVITINLLEHVLDLRTLLEQVGEVLNADGLFYIMTPGLFHYVSKVYPSLQYQLIVYHTYLFNEWNLTYVLGSCGFEKVFGDRFISSIWRKSGAESRVSPTQFDFHVPAVNDFLQQYGDTLSPSFAGDLYRRFLRKARPRADTA